jgi:hypothetical protein
MIAILKSGLTRHGTEIVSDQFLAILPQIRRQASLAFRCLRGEAREDLICEVIANAYCSWVSLVQQGRGQIARPTPLAKYALRQVRAGRRIGSRLNSHELLSPYARRIRGFTIERLHGPDESSGAWSQRLVEDRRAGPAETAAARLDLAHWLGTLSPRNRRIAKVLAAGETTGAVARRFGLSPGRVSQLRAMFRSDWERFQGAPRPELTRLGPC